MKIINHWLTDCCHIPSPNFDSRPDVEDIALVVIHCISLPPGEFGGGFIDELFLNQLNPEQHDYFAGIHNLKVSAHVLIRRDGSYTQYVGFNQRAWHAGVSMYQGRERCNDFSIGIELEGIETVAYTEAQYQALVELIKCLKQTYPLLSEQAIVGHSDIAPGRKTDPGESFDWQKLRAMLSA
ncbi:1,6-anhydro-N-acetylmuramyl-L-alanine amidase AmpD [Methylocucumis oryzae]|uniref:1,6-anhydro-N-acetylmuramyl-L-alanine amidase AmpD n=1 Tax=Methylocucumis oryzae TaxID=1632867 RepID=A0A0F3IJI5_9GAMM|nr:1,6-anhydro-N-acetylmuramyl-L-alanine amidase AmpD [Methylocucumis oryzae]KJV05709.1 N-acetyl-anhydromuranmyl-L-alanine amidase [Methylocucumis oryzae]